MGLIVDVDGSTGLSISAPCLEKQAGTLCSSRLGRGGNRSSISIMLLFFFFFNFLKTYSFL